jgi:hypothetical protein
MSQAFGHQAFVGYGLEVTPGTGVSATIFNEFLDESVKLDQKRNYKPTLGSVSQRYSVRSKRKVGGTIKMPLLYQGCESLFKYAMGACSSSLTDVTAYTHQFSLAAAMANYLTFVVNRDAAAIGGSSCFQYTGCQITKLMISQSAENFAELSVDIEGMDENLIAKPSPTFPTFKGVDWEMLSTFTIGGTTIPVKTFELSIENPLATDRYKLGSQTRIGLGRNGARKVSGKVSLEFQDLNLYNYFRSLGTAGALVSTFTGGTIAGSSTAYTFQLNAPTVILQGSTPNVKDAGPVTIEMPFECDASAGADNSELTATIKNLLTSVT